MTSKELYLGNLGTAATGNDRRELAEPPGTAGPVQVLKGRNLNRPSDARPSSEGLIPMSSETARRSIDREGTPDLRSHCPVCGDPSQPGEGLLALTRLSLATSAVPPSRPAAGCDPSSNIILGRQECVPQRLLTLPAGFQPEARFETASTDYFARESLL